MFSSRLPTALRPNLFSREVARLRAANIPLLDLTETNPTRVGLDYPDALIGVLADPRSLVYEPAPFGLPSARDAVAREMLRQGYAVPADHIVLSASTSEAYSALFKLLCDAGDEVLVPQPSYPLFELLTRLDTVHAAPYRLDDHGAWSIDRASLEARVSDRTRAVLVVSPNNPTGSLLRRDDLEWLSGLCRDRAAVLIADEVFIDYPLRPRPGAVRAMDRQEALTFTLGGLSKSAGLPQMKLAWTIVTGPDALVADAIGRLEVICDTYLSVAAPVQHAAPALLAAAQLVRGQLLARLQRNLSALRARVASAPAVSLREPEGGWSAVLQVPSLEPEEAIALSLLRDAHVIAHPGYFFDFSREAFFVVSLLPEPDEFDEATTRLLNLVTAGL